MRKYYVYVYLNTLKPGLFTYNNLSFDYEPFYVGKGFGKRYLHHLNKVKNKNKFKDSDKFQIITEIISSGVDPIILKIKDSLSEDDALLLENNLYILDFKNGVCILITPCSFNLSKL